MRQSVLHDCLNMATRHEYYNNIIALSSLPTITENDSLKEFFSEIDFGMYEMINTENDIKYLLSVLEIYKKSKHSKKQRIITSIEPIQNSYGKIKFRIIIDKNIEIQLNFKCKDFQSLIHINNTKITLNSVFPKDAKPETILNMNFKKREYIQKLLTSILKIENYYNNLPIK